MCPSPLSRPAARAPRRPVYVIDDDESVRVALERLLLSAGFRAVGFPGAREFLSAGVAATNACIITDVKMQGMTGLELHRRLLAEGVRAAFIFVTAYDTPEARREAREAGAIAYLRKPVDDQALIDAALWAMRAEEAS
jgi:FixJ family two-component response regulator